MHSVFFFDVRRQSGVCAFFSHWALLLLHNPSHDDSLTTHAKHRQAASTGAADTHARQKVRVAQQQADTTKTDTPPTLGQYIIVHSRVDA